MHPQSLALICHSMNNTPLWGFTPCVTPNMLYLGRDLHTGQVVSPAIIEAWTSRKQKMLLTKPSTCNPYKPQVGDCVDIQVETHLKGKIGKAMSAAKLKLAKDHQLTLRWTTGIPFKVLKVMEKGRSVRVHNPCATSTRAKHKLVPYHRIRLYVSPADAPSPTVCPDPSATVAGRSTGVVPASTVPCSSSAAPASGANLTGPDDRQCPASSADTTSMLDTDAHSDESDTDPHDMDSDDPDQPDPLLPTSTAAQEGADEWDAAMDRLGPRLPRALKHLVGADQPLEYQGKGRRKRWLSTKYSGTGWVCLVEVEGGRNATSPDTVVCVHATKKHNKRTQAELVELRQSCPTLMSLGLDPTDCSPSSPVSYAGMEAMVAGDPRKLLDLVTRMATEVDDYHSVSVPVPTSVHDLPFDPLYKHSRPARVGWVFKVKSDGSIRTRLCVRECFLSNRQEDCSCPPFSRDSWKLASSVWLRDYNQQQQYLAHTGSCHATCKHSLCSDPIQRVTIDLSKAFLTTSPEIASEMWKGVPKLCLLGRGDKSEVRELLSGAYGLKTAPAIFQASLDQTLQSIGWKPWMLDANSWHSPNKDCNAVACVDDIDLFGPKSQIDQVITAIKHAGWNITFSVSTPGVMVPFAGWETTMVQEDRYWVLQCKLKDPKEQLCLPSLSTLTHSVCRSLLGDLLWMSNLSPLLTPCVIAVQCLQALILQGVTGTALHENAFAATHRADFNRGFNIYRRHGSAVIFRGLSPSPALIMLSDASHNSTSKKCQVGGLLCATALGGKLTLLAHYSRKSTRVSESSTAGELIGISAALQCLEQAIWLGYCIDVVFTPRSLHTDSNDICSHVYSNYKKSQKGQQTLGYCYLKQKLAELCCSLRFCPGSAFPVDVLTKAFPARSNLYLLLSLIQTPCDGDLLDLQSADPLPLQDFMEE